MRKRRDWIVVAVIAVLLAAGVVLVGTAVPGATGGRAPPARRRRRGLRPLPASCCRSARTARFVKEYTLADLEAMTPFAGFAGFRNSGPTSPAPRR